MKKTFFFIVMIAIVAGMIELFSFLLLPALTGMDPSLREIRRRQQDLLYEGTSFVPEAGEGVPNQEIPLFMKREVLHPYIGFVAGPPNEKDPYGFGNTLNPVQNSSPEKVVIGFLGGSVCDQVYRWGLESIREQFRKNGLFTNREIVAVNLSTGGYKQPQQLMTVNYLLTLGAHFDILINIDGFNEVSLPVTENLPKGVFPAFPRCWDLRVQSTPSGSFLRGVGKITFVRALRRKAAALCSEGFLAHSRTVALAWVFWDRTLEKAIAREQLALIASEPESKNYMATGPRKSYPTESGLFGELCAVWERSSLLIRDLCRANGIEYFHFLQPNQYLPGSKDFTEEEKTKGYNGESWHRPAVEKGYPRLIEAGRRLAGKGVHFYDMTGLFSGEKGTIYIDNCCHYNETGNEIFGTAIGQAIAGYYRQEAEKTAAA